MSEGTHKAHMGNKAQIHSTTDSSSALSVWGCVCTCVCKYASEFDLLLLLLLVCEACWILRYNEIVLSSAWNSKTDT